MSTARTTRQSRERRGRRAEWMALALLTFKGYRLIVQRAKTPVGEIDLVMKRGKQLVFVEVKARRTRDDAAFAIHAKNQQRVMRAAQYFLAGHPQYAHCEVRFDVCLVAWYSLPAHLPHAFHAAQ